MDLRFRRSFRVLPGVRVNLGVNVAKSSGSTSDQPAESEKQRREKALDLFRGVAFIVALTGTVYVVSRLMFG
jgi:hypothetical protein